MRGPKPAAGRGGKRIRVQSLLDGRRFLDEVVKGYSDRAD
jgi:hypothetical protein